MASHAPPPLDEIRHSRPEIIDWYVNTSGQPMGEGMMHVYLAESPFFDHSSKNGLHFTHAQNNPAVVAFMQDRKRFEEDLRRHVGVEYLIVGEPQEVDKRAFVPDGKGGGRVEVQGRENSGIWVFRKQDRQRRRGDHARVQEEVETLGTYYCVGEGMYQAPAVGDIVGNKLLSATTHLNKFFGTAKELPSFDPTRGYTYLPQQTAVSLPGASSQASPARSREGSVLPNATAPPAADSQSLRSQSLIPDNSQTSNTTPSATKLQETALLARSFKQSLEFADEFTDENPLIGEPGHFSFTSSLAAVSARKRKAAEEEAAALAAKASKTAREHQQASAVGRDATVKIEEKAAVNEPPAVMSSAQVREVAKDGQKERRGSRMGGEKKRRTKSKAHLGSLVGVAEGGGT